MAAHEIKQPTPEGLVSLNLSAPRYDQATFFGRFRHFLQVTDSRTLFTTQSQLDEALKALSEYEQKGSPPVTAEEAERLWNFKKTRDAVIHPDTGEKIFPLFRLSSFVPTNVLICAGMLAPNPAMGSVIFWQWINQSYNIALNHANRNASNQLSNSTIAKTYAAAVAISCGVAVGLGELTKRVPLSPSMRGGLQRVVPFTAVSVAGVVNVFMMRWNETKQGITVFDGEGKELGKSKKAGFNALSQVAFSRVATSFPCLMLPPVVMNYFDSTGLFQKSPWLRQPVNLGVITVILVTALPASVAIFPQIVSTSPNKLETEFHHIVDRTGTPVDKVYYNKGL